MADQEDREAEAGSVYFQDGGRNVSKRRAAFAAKPHRSSSDVYALLTEKTVNLEETPPSAASPGPVILPQGSRGMPMEPPRRPDSGGFSPQGGTSNNGEQLHNVVGGGRGRLGAEVRYVQERNRQREEVERLQQQIWEAAAGLEAHSQGQAAGLDPLDPELRLVYYPTQTNPPASVPLSQRREWMEEEEQGRLQGVYMHGRTSIPYTHQPSPPHPYITTTSHDNRVLYHQVEPPSPYQTQGQGGIPQRTPVSYADIAEAHYKLEHPPPSMPQVTSVAPGLFPPPSSQPSTTYHEEVRQYPPMPGTGAPTNVMQQQGYRPGRRGGIADMAAFSMAQQPEHQKYGYPASPYGYDSRVGGLVGEHLQAQTRSYTPPMDIQANMQTRGQLMSTMEPQYSRSLPVSRSTPIPHPSVSPRERYPQVERPQQQYLSPYVYSSTSSARPAYGVSLSPKKAFPHLPVRMLKHSKVTLSSFSELSSPASSRCSSRRSSLDGSKDFDYQLGLESQTLSYSPMQGPHSLSATLPRDYGKTKETRETSQEHGSNSSSSSHDLSWLKMGDKINQLTKPFQSESIQGSMESLASSTSVSSGRTNMGTWQDSPTKQHMDPPTVAVEVTTYLPTTKSTTIDTIDTGTAKSDIQDEGIVTEADMTISPPTMTQLFQSWDAIKREAKTSKSPESESVPLLQSQTSGTVVCVTDSATTQTEALSAHSGDVGSKNDDGAGGSLPGVRRRQRKGSAANGSDGSGSSSESNGENRSLSDPTPNRKHAYTEDNFVMDSNLLGSLSSHQPAVAGSNIVDRATSVESDISACSDQASWSEPDDSYNVISSIINEPGALDKAEEKNGKNKKKSLSDPSPAKNNELTGLVDTMNESEHLATSNSEPVLSKDKEERVVSVRGAYSFEEQRMNRLLTEEERVQVINAPLEAVRDATVEMSPQMMRRKAKRSRGENGRNGHGNGEVEHVVSPSGKATVSIGIQVCTEEDGDEEEEPEVEAVVVEKVDTKSVSIGVQSSDLPKRQKKSSTSDAASPVNNPKIETPHTEVIASPKKETPVQLRRTGSKKTSTSELSITTKDAGVVTPSPEKELPVPSEETPTSPTSPKEHDMRKHVAQNLLETERSYVDGLQALIEGYLKPLKRPENAGICESELVDKIFYQIPEILEHHQHFLEQITNRTGSWHPRQKIGDIIVNTFTKDLLVESYRAYINNFLTAKAAVRMAEQAKPVFSKFLEQCVRENKEKQGLADLMIKPVQRIPRYELLIKDLLKHTPEDHPDYSSLRLAQEEIRTLAERMNRGEQEVEEMERHMQLLRELEALIEGVGELVATHRRFIHQDIIYEMQKGQPGSKKERSLFLFSDLLICTTYKRRTGSLRRSSMNLFSMSSNIDAASKYKVLWKLSLDQIEVIKGEAVGSSRVNLEHSIQKLEEDLSAFREMVNMADSLNSPHQPLTELLHDLLEVAEKQLQEKQALQLTMKTHANTKLELTTSSLEGMENFIYIFGTPEAKSSWETAFTDAKQKLASSKQCWDPVFLKPIPIMKTRSGMQFSCASPSLSSVKGSNRFVWICNSDGYVGQVCLLSMGTDPSLAACISVCSARIFCITAVPAINGAKRTAKTDGKPQAVAKKEKQQESKGGNSDSSDEEVSSPTNKITIPPIRTQPSLSPFLSHQQVNTGNKRHALVISEESDSDTEDDAKDADNKKPHDVWTEMTDKQKQEQQMREEGEDEKSRQAALGEGFAFRKTSFGTAVQGSLEDLLVSPSAAHNTMWLGTEDGCIHIYQCGDPENIRKSKNRTKLQHTAAVQDILYLDNKVFVSLANGDMVVYRREPGCGWDLQQPITLTIGNVNSPITRMLAVAGRVWCGCQNNIMIMNTTSLTVEHSYEVTDDSSRVINCIVSMGLGVWVSLLGSAQLRLFHATSYSLLLEVDVAPAVHKMLAGSDAIIRQHKAACLRITALLACKDLLWVGTSAGVVVTVPLPHITTNTTSLRHVPTVLGSSHGHTGHVRFLTAVELSSTKRMGNVIMGSLKSGNSWRSQDECSSVTPALSMLVISGGDGYEDFHLSFPSDTAGRDDSTNHLLLWQV
ncbi:rho guanine nucleotide exchange factor 17-like isoform X1 [Branchiostoma lanceolatum]|uniref:rho guanine nucleotide exchange factor 17-like isoform X1 n=1 Tax=Branchiostoma lanceolatum TaxID=7740 RepID=UPI003454F032